MSKNLYKLTKEQENILKAVKENNSICIYAFAGAGKTSTLKEIAINNKDKTILYLAFNKAIADSSRSSFPSNVNVLTTNALAYKYTANDLKLSFNLKTGSYRAIEIGEMFLIKDYAESNLALSLFEGFCNSGFQKIDKECVEIICQKQDGIREQYYSYLKSKFPAFGRHQEDADLKKLGDMIEDKIIVSLTSIITKMWDCMLNGSMKVTHGFYLKYFHLNIKRYLPLIKYDFILLDEAQDSNLVTLDIFTQLDGKKILVGDSHQNIYGFRGSSNIMEKFKSDIVLYLSNSFRFNEKIAGYADKILKQYKGETETLKSANNIVGRDNSIAYITRTNAKLIEMVDEINSSRKTFNFVRNPEEIFRRTLSVYYMIRYFASKNFDMIKAVKDKYLCSFKNIEEMSEYAEETDDRELKSALNINQKYPGRQIEDLYNKCLDVFAGGNGYIPGQIILTTAHSAKGLEWDSVYIQDDFPDFAKLIHKAKIHTVGEFRDAVKKGGYNSKLSGIIEEFNLFYVASTRAKHDLVVRSENNRYIYQGDVAINAAISAIEKEEKRDSDFSL